MIKDFFGTIFAVNAEKIQKISSILKNIRLPEAYTIITICE